MATRVFKMTEAGKAELEAELEHLETVGRNDIAEKLKVARSYGDLSENSEYDEAKNDQAKIEAYSKVPGKKQLIAMLMSTINGPVQKLAATLQAYVDKKTEEGAN